MTTRVLLRILDLRTGSSQSFGPIIDSLSYPIMMEAGTTATFAISAVAPKGDPLTYEWSSSCADATFGTPHDATTVWSKPAEGTCTISVVVTADGASVVQSFAISVFPAGGGAGAVDVTGIFVTPPIMQFFLAAPFCNVAPGSNASCSGRIAPSGTAQYRAFVPDWGTSSPGTLALTDDCGGQSTAASQVFGVWEGTWRAPATPGICILTLRATNTDGLATDVSAAVLVRAGTPRPPVISAQLGNGCPFGDVSSPTECASVATLGIQSALGAIDWRGAIPFDLVIADSCGGRQGLSPAQRFHLLWSLGGGTVGQMCEVTVEALNSDGDTTTVAARYPLTATP